MSNNAGAVFSFWEHQIQQLFPRRGKICLVGVGETSKGDDAAGVRLIGRLKKKACRFFPNVQLINAGRVPENFSGVIRDFAPDLVLFIDAVNSGKKAGEITLFRAEDLPREELSSHQLPLKMLIDYIHSEVSCQVRLIGIQPKQFSSGSRLSAPVSRSVKELQLFFERRREWIGVG